MARNEPLAPKPSKASETTMKAKWYHWATEKTLVRPIWRVSVAVEIRNIPI